MRPQNGSIELAREVINRYDEEIRFADDQLGRLVDALRRRPDWSNTALLVMGDHGEALNQHGRAGHGDTWEEQLHAPLVIRVPGIPPRRLRVALSAADVLPTFAELARLPQAAALLEQASGRNVLDPGYEEQPILSQDTGRERAGDEPYRYALRSGRWKLFRTHSADGSVRDSLFDLDRDPFELRDVREVNLALAEELGERASP